MLELEKELISLYAEIHYGVYRHGGYRHFYVTDNKKRKISVAGVRDRVVQRMVYEYLVKLYDKRFVYDVWSCRKKKGLHGALARIQKFIRNKNIRFVWRADISKYFDSIDRATLLDILRRKINGPVALYLLNEIINSAPGEKGLPIGNITSQVLSNVYLNELDRYVKIDLKVAGYARYGDDFIVTATSFDTAVEKRTKISAFLSDKLKLSLNAKSDKIIKIKQGIPILGQQIFRKGKRLNKRNITRINRRLKMNNIASYAGLIADSDKQKKRFTYAVLELIEQENNDRRI
jgi:retron-type reverse transcriptase